MLAQKNIGNIKRPINKIRFLPADENERKATHTNR